MTTTTTFRFIQKTTQQNCYIYIVLFNNHTNDYKIYISTIYYR